MATEYVQHIQQALDILSEEVGEGLHVPGSRQPPPWDASRQAVFSEMLTEQRPAMSGTWMAGREVAVKLLCRENSHLARDRVAW